MDSLREKLLLKTKYIKEQEEQRQQQEIDESLQLVRQKICNLEDHRQKLAILHESLIAKKMNGGGIGMSEHAQRVSCLRKTRADRINELMLENKQELEAMGIKNRDELTNHPEFSQTEEVSDYRESLKNTTDLAEADSALLNRLTELGIKSDQEISKPVINYELLVTVLVAELAKVDQKIITEKMKTQEGRQEIIDVWVEKIVSQLPSFSFDRDIDRNYYLNNWGDYRNKIYFGNNFMKSNMDLQVGGIIPKKLEEITKLTNAQLLPEILETAYRYKFDRAVEKFDEQHEKWRGLQKQMIQDQILLPKLEKQLEKITELQKVIPETLREKSVELSKNGINFDSINITGYGGRYSDLTKLHRFEKEANLITEISTTDKLPISRLDKVQNYLIAKIANLQNLLDKIGKLNSSVDVQKFLSDNVRGIASIHRNSLASEDLLNNSNNSDYEDLLNNFFQKKPTFSEAKKFVDEQVNAQNEVKDKMLDKILMAAKIQLKQDELNRVLDKNMINSTAKYDMEAYLSNLEHTKENARQILINIQQIKNKLPNDEELILKGRWLNVPSAEIKIKTLCQRRDELKKELRETLNNLEIHQQQKPKLFGVKAWKNKLDKLLDDKKNSESNLRAQELSITKHQENLIYDIYGQESYLIKDLLNKTEVRGRREEVFCDLISELNNIIDQQVPGDVLSVYQELQELKNKW